MPADSRISDTLGVGSPSGEAERDRHAERETERR